MVKTLREFVTFLALLLLAMATAYAIGHFAGAPDCKPATSFFLQGTGAECAR